MLSVLYNVTEELKKLLYQRVNMKNCISRIKLLQTNIITLEINEMQYCLWLSGSMTKHPISRRTIYSRKPLLALLAVIPYTTLLTTNPFFQPQVRKKWPSLWLSSSSSFSGTEQWQYTPSPTEPWYCSGSIHLSATSVILAAMKSPVPLGALGRLQTRLPRLERGCQVPG